MRIKKTAFLSCAMVAALALVASPAAMATGGGSSCSSFNPNVTVLQGPCPVSSANPAACDEAGSLTGIQYKVTGSPEYIAALVTANNTVAAGITSFAACAGDPVTGLGAKSCHEKAVRFTCGSSTATFWVVVEGRKAAVLQSVAVKKNSCVKSFAVAGLGSDINPFQTTQKTETVNFKGCAVNFLRDSLSGEVLSAQLDPSQSTKPSCSSSVTTNCCSDVITTTIDKLSLTIEGVGTLGAGQIGEGYVSSGVNSCTTRVIGGRVYTWGSPCPED